MANSTVISNIFGALTNGSVLFANGSGVVSQDNTNFFWDDTNNRLGIGTSSPTEPLYVRGNIRANNDGLNASILYLGQTSPTGNWEGDIRFLTTNLYKNWRISSNRVANGVFTITPSDTNGGDVFTTPALTINQNGCVGIGLTPATRSLEVTTSTENEWSGLFNSSATSPYGVVIRYNNTPNNNSNAFIGCADSGGYRFYVYSNGNVVNQNNSYGGISDVNLKENITNSTPKLSKILQVRVVNYNLKDDPDRKNLIGVVAQELELLFPSLVEDTTRKIKDENGNEINETVKSVKYSVFVPILIKALQEEDAKVQALTDKVSTLETELANTKKELSDLKQLLLDKGVI